MEAFTAGTDTTQVAFAYTAGLGQSSACMHADAPDSNTVLATHALSMTKLYLDWQPRGHTRLIVGKQMHVPLNK